MPLQLFERRILKGELTLVEASGAHHRFGTGTPRATWVMRKPDTLSRILKNPAMELGETYLDEGWDVTDGTLADLLTILRNNLNDLAQQRTLLTRFAALLNSWNDLKASIANVHHHYDLDEDLFRAFLDRDMHYSCAYFRDSDMSLESAQMAKCNHIARKLLLAPGQRVLDIGCGWGSLALHLAESADVSVTGLTLSAEQLRVARDAAARRGLIPRVEFHAQDYRKHYGQYDRIVSVGMFEHVGRRNFRRYFEQLARQLRPKGVALLHTIGSTRPPKSTNAWVRRHIFPGGYLPSLSTLCAAIEQARLMIGDIEILRPHYALTLKEWNRRFQAQRERFAASKGERFCRMWEFYLVTSQTAFEYGDLVVYQVQLGGRDAPFPATR
ncbi:MAG TPA: cyclopropane-fatty-acyl-phospholipid synthase family protein, partial [Pseudomonadales bacterium]